MTYIKLDIKDTSGRTKTGWYTGVALDITSDRKKALCYLEDDLAVRTATLLTHVYKKGVKSVVATIEKKI